MGNCAFVSAPTVWWSAPSSVKVGREFKFTVGCYLDDKFYYVDTTSGSVMGSEDGRTFYAQAPGEITFGKKGI